MATPLVQPATVKYKLQSKTVKRGQLKKKPSQKVSYHNRPADLSLEQWQTALRKQFGALQQFEVKNTGAHPVFSDYHVYNPETKNKYKVSIRSNEPGPNFCSCMDFKTNGLWTCKHVEFVLETIRSNPRKSGILKKGFDPHYTSVYLHYGKEKEVRIRVGSENKKEFERLASKYFSGTRVLNGPGFSSFEKFLEEAHAIHSDFRCYTDALEFILNIRETEKRNSIIDNIPPNREKWLKEFLSVSLFPYQREGIEFALRAGRCLIADDMGLGKTIQALGVAESLKKLFGISKVLVVCPTSLKYQWKSEIEKFTSSDLCVIEGNLFTREKQYTGEEFYKICSYNVVGRDLDSINKNEFDLIILDEAQRIKNWKTAAAMNVKKIRSKYALVLTGTPVENKLEELYSIIQVVDPFRLGALFRFVHDHQIVDEQGKVTGYKDLNNIGRVLSDVMIRRHKRDVLKQLPSRMDKNLFVPMTQKQEDYYEEALEVVVKMVNKWKRFRFLNEKDRQRLLINLNKMRMACDSTFILDQETRHDTKVGELMNILEGVMENGNEKVVVFSQWERMTRIVALEMDSRNIKYENLNGSIPSRDRDALFRNFNSDPDCRVFLSTDAGGVGLNLQAASMVVNLDLPWNPAVLEQRIGRVHRMGQKKNVQVINLISANTIEEQMLGKLKFKSSMAAGILDNGESTVFLGESKFNTLMKQVEEIAVNAEKPATVSETEIQPTPEFPVEGVNGIKMIDRAEGQNGNVAHSSSSAEQLLASGSGFFGQLMETLSDTDKTAQLMNMLVKTDPASGKTFLQIPVKNAAVVENGLKLLGQLLRNP